MHLADINFWLALTFDLHQHHAAAKSWFDGLLAGSQIYFCRYTQLGFLRLSTNSAANPLQTQTMAQAWANYDQALRDPRIGFSPEPPGLEVSWRHLTLLATKTHNMWNDAYLQAYATAAGLRVVTFDIGFRQFPGFNGTILP